MADKKGSVEERVCRIVRECGDLKVVTPWQNFQTELGFDSLEMVEAARCIEDEFGITIPDEAFHTFVTVQNVIDYIESLR